MGFIRGGLLFVVGVLLLLSLLIGNVLLVLSSSLQYENIQEKLTPVIGEIIFEQTDISKFQESFDIMKEYCEQGNKQVIVKEESYDFEISCDEILTGTPEGVLDSQVEKFLQENYYKEYDCEFFDCFEENPVPFFLISEMTHNYIQSKYYYVLVVSLVLLVVMFFLVEDKRNLLIIAGILLILSSLPFMKLNAFSSAVSGDYSSQIFSLFFEQARVVFWWMFVIGLLILGTGIGLRFWNFEKAKKIFERKKRKKKK